ncbi:hypothetical protein PQC13_gp271 [Synechococcus phage S-SRM01]|uniref:Uncharacterized protein n=1 Tax=Synechococcus phage S-SRM01 TaxID=2781608 RepID=A0A879R3C9_9CAUD|nr:hypothetical protein PQC13_gp271 [Synechococcus phage S-SRM01]QPX48236.1 hypothetical protein [Synechococcus phage S-SRM01]
MSRISQDFINSVGYLYEEINIQQNDFLNEESQYYDAEVSELVEDILATISTSMVYEGYSAEGIIGFLADSSEQDIVEKYLSFDENILTESVVSEDYITEQLELFDVAIDEGIGSLIGKVAKGAIGLAGRVASKPARAAVAKKMMTSKNPAKTAAAVDRLARMKLNKAGAPSDITKKLVDAAPDVSTKTRIAATAPVVGKLVKGAQKVKDIGQGAKKALPGIAKGAGIFGLGAAGGYVGAKMAGAGSGTKSTESQRPPASADASADAPSAPSTPGSRTSSTPAPKAPSTRSSASGSKPRSKDAARPGETPMQQWARLHPNLAAKVKPGQSGYEEISQTRVKPGPYEKQNQTPTQGPSTAQIDTKDVDAAIKAEQERQKKRLEQQKNTSMTAKESYEPYDVVLNYLMSEGHADTLDEANYIMLEMDEKAIGTIIEEYEDYLLAEEIQEWVNSLLDEGYDLSEYSWDDVVEYYVTEAKYGTAKGRKKLAKKVRAGKDVGKKGAGFEAIVDKASGKYGKKRATKIAAAAMWKNLGK